MICRNIKNSKRGFTLIEMLVAVVLLTAAITGPMSIASKGLTASIVAKDQITAFFLAQDAVEYARFIRENNKLCINMNQANPGSCPSATTWLAGLDGTSNQHLIVGNNLDGNNGDCVSPNGLRACYMDPVRDFITSCTSNNCSTAPLKYNFNNSSYTTANVSACVFPTSGICQTIFKRTVRVINDPAGASPNEAVIMVRVEWSDQANVNRVVEVRENIFNWQ